MHLLSKCPLCQSDCIHTVHSAIDFLVSGESFNILECESCQLRFTDPVPAEDNISNYYKSEEYAPHSTSITGVVNIVYRIIRAIMLKRKRKIIEAESFLTAGRILDIGCGTGEFLNEMSNHDWVANGIEPDKNARDFAISQFRLQISSPEKFFNSQPEKYNVITMWHVLEHIYDHDRYLLKVRSVLVKDGVLILALPNYNSLDADYYGSFWAAYDVPRHLYHFSMSSLIRLLEKYRFKFIKVLPLPFDSFYVSILSEKYKKGNFINGGWQGLKSYLNTLHEPKRCSSLLYIFRLKPD